MVDGDSVCFLPNRLERLRPDTSWECPVGDVTGVKVNGKIWLVVETTGGSETFRVFGATAVAPRVTEALRPAV